MSEWGIMITTWIAATVEWVEAFTIVLAVSLSIGWPKALGAATAALGVLIVLTLATGGALMAGVTSLPWLQIVIGIFLLLFGTRWLAKAIARSAGLKALHDEDAEFSETRAHLQEDPRGAWLIAFKGVLLEGLEVWLIVVALGTPMHHTTAAGIAAIVALVMVAIVGAMLHRPLRQVPENSMKFFVGAMITGFGTFWTLEGLGYHWPMSDLSLLLLVAFYLVSGLLMVRLLVHQRNKTPQNRTQGDIV